MSLIQVQGQAAGMQNLSIPLLASDKRSGHATNVDPGIASKRQQTGFMSPKEEARNVSSETMPCPTHSSIIG